MTILEKNSVASLRPTDESCLVNSGKDQDRNRFLANRPGTGVIPIKSVECFLRLIPEFRSRLGLGLRNQQQRGDEA